jgi:hypothetical protein
MCRTRSVICLPSVVRAEVRLDAVAPATVGATHGDLVAGLGIEAEARKDPRTESATVMGLVDCGTKIGG